MEIHNFKRRLERRLEIVQESALCKEDKELLYKFKDYCFCQTISYGKIERYLIDIMKYCSMLKKPIAQATKEDVMHVIVAFSQEGYSEESKKSFKIMLRRLYRLVHGIEEKGVYPEEVKWISISMPPNHKKLPEELLTAQELQNIIRQGVCVRDRALLACLSESGCRVGEIGTMSIKHVSFETYGARLTVQGKTGMRKILVITSAPYLQEWINQHPLNTNPEAPLWHHFQSRGYLSYARIARILKTAAKRAGIKKRVHPHLLRHSRATALASLMSDSSLKHYLGWTQGSKMASIYIHMSGKETDEVILRENGIEVSREAKESSTKPLTCPRCKTINESTNRFCKQCSFILEAKAQQELMQKELSRSELEKKLKKLLKFASPSKGEVLVV